jgi:aminodeoxyfutalosine synthase
VLRELIAAGLGSLPGGGAEIFHPRARTKLCHDKVDADGWLEVHRVAHRLGLRSNCTMLFGSIETIEERVDHVLRLRELQDETGGFQTFIPLRFHHENNRLARIKEPTGFDSLRTYAVSRLLLDNFDHIKGYWIMLGVPLAQVALDFGVDDLDGTVREERIYHMAGANTPQEMTRSGLIALIRAAGRIPVERDTLYNVVAEA